MNLLLLSATVGPAMYLRPNEACASFTSKIPNNFVLIFAVGIIRSLVLCLWSYLYISRKACYLFVLILLEKANHDYDAWATT